MAKFEAYLHTSYEPYSSIKTTPTIMSAVRLLPTKRRYGEIIVRSLILTNATGVFGLKHMKTVIREQLYCCTRACPQNIPIKDVSHFRGISQSNGKSSSYLKQLPVYHHTIAKINKWIALPYIRLDFCCEGYPGIPICSFLLNCSQHNKI